MNLFLKSFCRPFSVLVQRIFPQIQTSLHLIQYKCICNETLNCSNWLKMKRNQRECLCWVLYTNKAIQRSNQTINRFISREFQAQFWPPSAATGAIQFPPACHFHLDFCFYPMARMCLTISHGWILDIDSVSEGLR